MKKGGKEKMIVKQIISKSKDGNRMEVIAKEDNIQKTLHIHQGNDTWRYFAGCDKKGKQVFLTITI